MWSSRHRRCSGLRHPGSPASTPARQREHSLAGEGASGQRTPISISRRRAELALCGTCVQGAALPAAGVGRVAVHHRRGCHGIHLLAGERGSCSRAGVQGAVTRSRGQASRLDWAPCKCIAHVRRVEGGIGFVREGVESPTGRMLLACSPPGVVGTAVTQLSSHTCACG